jgi:hypothetical protein
MTAQAYRRQLVPDKQSGSNGCDVADPNVEPVVLPVGFEKFHRRGFLNYQFNRAHGLGWADGNELGFAQPWRGHAGHHGWPCRRDTTSNSPPSGRPKMLSRPYLAIRVTLANTRLAYSSRRPSDRTISTGVIGVTVRGTERSSAIDPFRSLFGRSPSMASAPAPT